MTQLEILREVEARRRERLSVGDRVSLLRPFTLEPAEGVITERKGNECLVVCCGETVVYGIDELQPKG